MSDTLRTDLLIIDVRAYSQEKLTFKLLESPGSMLFGYIFLNIQFNPSSFLGFS